MSAGGPVDGQRIDPTPAIEAAAKAVLRWSNDQVPERDRLSWGELDADWQKDMLAAANAALRAALPSLLEAVAAAIETDTPGSEATGYYGSYMDAGYNTAISDAASLVRGLVPVDGQKED